MWDKNARRPQAAGDGLRTVFIFLFFLLGALSSRTVLGNVLPAGEDAIPKAGLYALCFCAVPVFSSSVWGTVLLPGCALVFGCVCGQHAAELVRTLYAGAGMELRSLLVCLTAVPLFFLLAVRGMRISGMLGAMLDRSGVQARADYNREYIPLILTVLTGMIAVYFLIG